MQIHEYEYVTRAEYSPVQKDVEAIIRKAQRIMKEKYDFHFSYELIGSGKKHLITRKKNSKTGYDFDYNLIIDTLENGYRYVAKNVNELVRLAFNEACKGSRFKCPEDSTSVLTLKCVDRKNKRIKYSFDIAIIYYASDDLDDGYYYLKNWKNGGYSFVFRKLSKNVDWKLDEILNYDNGWNMIREESLKLKNAKCESIYTKKASKNKMPIVFAIVLLAVAICGYFGVNKYKSYVYQQKLNSIIYIIIDSGAEAEECGNLIHNVWYNTIFYVSNTDTDKYTKTNGCFNDDFNDSLDNLYKSKYFTKKFPPKYKEAYKNLLVLYNEYIDFSNIVINPEGSLQSFTDKFNEKDESFVNSYDKMKLYID